MLERFSPWAARPGSAFLDSCLEQKDSSCYGGSSVMGTNPFLILEGKDNRIKITTPGKTTTFHGNPLDHLERLLNEQRNKTTPGFFGPGAIGYISYELGYALHKIPHLKPLDDLHLPDLWFAFYDNIVVHENGCAAVPPLRRGEQVDDRDVSGAERSFTRETYEKAFWKIMEHIRSGDIYQANLCQRFRAPFIRDPWETYLRLRSLHPTSLSAFLNTGKNCILSASPELFLKRQGDEIKTAPIKGTIPKSERKAEEKLLKSEKDRAEHIMIVDLERNDLGRVCEAGSISPEGMLRVESCGKVFHLVTTVKGKLSRGIGISEILRATFPGGSITGAPKKSAMKIIGNAEPCVRGVYTGALGWIGFSGNFILNIPIRTILIQDHLAHFYVGGGIVADSTPDGEYQETLDKGGAFLKVLDVEENFASPV